MSIFFLTESKFALDLWLLAIDISSKRIFLIWFMTWLARPFEISLRLSKNDKLDFLSSSSSSFCLLLGDCL